MDMVIRINKEIINGHIYVCIVLKMEAHIVKFIKF